MINKHSYLKSKYVLVKYTQDVEVLWNTKCLGFKHKTYNPFRR